MMAAKPNRSYRALGWVGGKSIHGAHGTGKWIHSLLPPVGTTYTWIEPFCGMAGLTLMRPPHRREILNDMDDDLMNWFEVVKFWPEQLGDLLDFTPGWSARLFGKAVENLDHEDPLMRAYYFTLAVHWVRGGMIGRVRQAAAKMKEEGREDYAIQRHKASREDRYQKAAEDDDGIRRQKKMRLERFEETVGLPKRKQEQEMIEGTRHPEPTAADAHLKRATIQRADADAREWRREQGGAEALKDDGLQRQKESRHEIGAEYRLSRPERWAQGRKKVKPGKGGEMSPPRHPTIMKLAERLKDVELEIRPAEWIVEYYCDNPNITYYLDPPYPSAAEKSSLYTFNRQEVEPWIPRLLAIRGLAAISGYGDEWAALEQEGWLRHEYRTHASVGAQHDRERPEKVEVLWTNYNPAEYSMEPALF